MIRVTENAVSIVKSLILQVCGGGPELAVWYLGSFSLAKTMSSDKVQHKCVTFHEDKVRSGVFYGIFRLAQFEGVVKEMDGPSCFPDSRSVDPVQRQFSILH